MTKSPLQKDGGELPAGRHSLDGGNLTIADIAEEDRGVYVCTVANEAASVSVDTELLIENVPPRAPYNLTAVVAVDSIHLSWLPGRYCVTVRGPLLALARWHVAALFFGRSQRRGGGLQRVVPRTSRHRVANHENSVTGSHRRHPRRTSAGY